LIQKPNLILIAEYKEAADSIIVKHKYERLQPPNVFNLYLGQANKSDSDLKV